MKKILDFGKIDYYKKGRKINRVTIEVELREEKKGLVLSICGNIWNGSGTDIICGGQNIDEISEIFKHNKKVQRIKEIWEKYHLNNMHSGTILQENAIEEWKKQGNKYDYNEVCKMLEKNNLLYDNDYRYGTSWLFREIPKEVIEEIKTW